VKSIIDEQRSLLALAVVREPTTSRLARRILLILSFASVSDEDAMGDDTPSVRRVIALVNLSIRQERAQAPRHGVFVSPEGST
jgi:hypothetical protein